MVEPTHPPHLAAAHQLTRPNAATDPRPLLPERLPTPDVLTPRELEVLRQLSTGAGSRAIAAALVLSPRTVERHIANLYAKTGIRCRDEALAYAHHFGLAD